jgi:hypothetical protein
MRNRVDRVVTTPTIAIRQRRSTDGAASISLSLKNPEIDTGHADVREKNETLH